MSAHTLSLCCSVVTETCPGKLSLRNAVVAMRVAVLGFACVCLTASAVGCNDNTATVGGDRAPTVTTSTVRPAVAWPAASSVDERALSSLARDGSKGEREVRALIARSPVPVLAPKDLVLASPTLVVEGEYFALTGRVDGTTIALQGTRAAHRYEGVEPAAGNRTVRATKGFVSINEGIRTVSWIENGAAYSVDLECADPRDGRCQSDDFLLSVVTQLTYVGGSGR
jgi:hypothetical protein